METLARYVREAGLTRIINQDMMGAPEIALEPTAIIFTRPRWVRRDWRQRALNQIAGRSCANAGRVSGTSGNGRRFWRDKATKNPCMAKPHHHA